MSNAVVWEVQAGIEWCGKWHLGLIRDMHSLWEDTQEADNLLSSFVASGRGPGVSGRWDGKGIFMHIHFEPWECVIHESNYI